MDLGFSLGFSFFTNVPWGLLRATGIVIGIITGSMLGILYTFWGVGFLVFMKKGSFFLPGVMWAKYRVQGFCGRLFIVHDCSITALYRSIWVCIGSFSSGLGI